MPPKATRKQTVAVLPPGLALEAQNLTEMVMSGYGEVGTSVESAVAGRI